MIGEDVLWSHGSQSDSNPFLGFETFGESGFTFVRQLFEAELVIDPVVKLFFVGGLTR